MMDEVKIKSDLMWNLADDSLVAFCHVSSNPKQLREKLKSLLSTENKDKDDVKEHAVYANQWRFRSCRNEIHTAEYFFNNGNLDADEILRQLIHVTTNYENVSIQIHGVCSDAGGSNEGLFSA